MGEPNFCKEPQPPKRVALDGDALLFRVQENGIYFDRIYVRDESQPRGNNVWRQLGSYAELKDWERSRS